jgi:CRISPR/Cas system-associated exonuclease Cas4 (RecB family)
VASPADDQTAGWVTASDLADYEFCPRAYWYRKHPPIDGPSPASVARRATGEQFHARTLSTRLRRERWSTAWWWLVAAGLLLCLLSIAEVLRP